jgi:hypothetical protein
MKTVEECMKTIDDYEKENPELFSQEELILEATELISEVMAQTGINATQLSTRLNKPCNFVARYLDGSEELSLRAISDIFGAMGYRLKLSAAPTA